MLMNIKFWQYFTNIFLINLHTTFCKSSFYKKIKEQNNIKTIQQTDKDNTKQAKLIPFKGVLHPNLKLACLVWYLKVINIFSKNNACIIK